MSDNFGSQKLHKWILVNGKLGKLGVGKLGTVPIF